MTVKTRAPIFAGSRQKIGYAATSVERSVNDCQIDNLHQYMSINPENLVRIDPVCSKIIGLVKKERQITSAYYKPGKHRPGS